MPDIQAINPKTGAETIIEVSTFKKGKGKQKSIMKRADPDAHYVVFCLDKLQAIREKFPQYNLLDWPEVNDRVNGNESGHGNGSYNGNGDQINVMMIESVAEAI